jgi:formamidopyrimidine-DNA glycosylase
MSRELYIEITQDMTPETLYEAMANIVKEYELSSRDLTNRLSDPNTRLSHLKTNLPAYQRTAERCVGTRVKQYIHISHRQFYWCNTATSNVSSDYIRHWTDFYNTYSEVEL